MVVAHFQRKRVRAYGRVAVPDVGVDVPQRLAGVGVDELDVQEQGHALLVLGHVAADEFSSDI